MTLLSFISRLGSSPYPLGPSVPPSGRREDGVVCGRPTRSLEGKVCDVSQRLLLFLERLLGPSVLTLTTAVTVPGPTLTDERIGDRVTLRVAERL